MEDVEIESYGRDYRPDDRPRFADHGARAGDRHVALHDPLRAVAVADSGAEADVQLGVDPGTFYCADQFAELIALARSLAGATTVGFIHVPPDRRTGAAAAAAEHLHDRTALLEQCARVVAVAVRGMVGGASDATLMITGFGPFAGVADNPTAAFVSDDAILERAVRLAIPDVRSEGRAPLADVRGEVRGRRHRFASSAGRAIRVVTAVLPLAASERDALAGRYFDPDTTAGNFRAWVAATVADDGGRPPCGIVSLGVDSGQILRGVRPAFRVETQTRGFHGPHVRGRTATDEFQRNLDLARVFMRARQRGDGLLRCR